MCRDNSYLARIEEHQKRWTVESFGENWNPSYHLQPAFSDWPVIIHDSVSGHNVSPTAHWGLIPFWTKNKADGLKLCNSMVNARTETILEKRAYKDLIYNRRCILPSTGFFEHHHIMRGKKDVSIPFYVKVRQKDIFGLAAIYTTWKDPANAEVAISFSVLTTDANEHMARIHNHGDNQHRMPVVITREMEEAWLNRKTPQSQVDQIKNFRIDSDSLISWPVSTIRGKARLEGEAIITRSQVEEIDWA